MRRDAGSGLLTPLFVLPISGRFPKDFAISDDNKFLLAMNNESNTISTFTINYESNTIAMNGPFTDFYAGNCLIIHRLA